MSYVVKDKIHGRNAIMELPAIVGLLLFKNPSHVVNY